MKMSRLAALLALALAFCWSLPYPVWAGEYVLVCSYKDRYHYDPKFKRPQVLVITSDGVKVIENKGEDLMGPLRGDISHLFISTINEMTNDGFEPVGGVYGGIGLCQALYDD